jgi:hypothetical protein
MAAEMVELAVQEQVHFLEPLVVVPLTYSQAVVVVVVAPADIMVLVASAAVALILAVEQVAQLVLLTLEPEVAELAD